MPAKEQVGAMTARGGGTCTRAASEGVRMPGMPLSLSCHSPLLILAFSQPVMPLETRRPVLQARLPEFETSHMESSGN